MVLAVAGMVMLVASPVLAVPPIRWHPSPMKIDPAKAAALVMDGETGKVLYALNADVERHPASLTKLMTLYLLFGALKQGRLKLSDELTFSPHAASQAATNLHVAPGDRIRVDDAIRALVVHSANDAAVAIAEALGGTESHFAQMMTAEARALGMRNTFFHNATGLPDPLQITTARDLAILARHVAYDYPQYFHFFATRDFTYRNVHYFTFDGLIGHYKGADGMKTGFVTASGFNLVSSVVRNGVHIIAVMMGGRTERGRDEEMMNLLNAVFAAVARNPTLVAHDGVPWQEAHPGSTYAPPIAVAFASIPVPAPRPDTQTAQTSAAERWAIQIGAFANPTLAHAELSAYAHKAGTLLQDAEPIVVPFEADDGHVLYRARFGSFRQLEARRLCNRLMRNGQTCFAALR